MTVTIGVITWFVKGGENYSQKKEINQENKSKLKWGCYTVPYFAPPSFSVFITIHQSSSSSSCLSSFLSEFPSFALSCLHHFPLPQNDRVRAIWLACPKPFPKKRVERNEVDPNDNGSERLFEGALLGWLGRRKWAYPVKKGKSFRWNTILISILPFLFFSFFIFFIFFFFALLSLHIFLKKN